MNTTELAARIKELAYEMSVATADVVLRRQTHHARERAGKSNALTVSQGSRKHDD